MMRIITLFIFSILTGCHAIQPVTGISYKGYPVGKTTERDSSYINMLRPYSDSVGKTMNQVLVYAANDLKKEVPNSSLGNFLADAYLAMARKKFNPQTDVAFMNHGGVRIPRIAAGPIIKGTIYEVMPFDNVLVLVEVKGAVLAAYLDRIAAEGGGGGVAGLTMVINNKKAAEIYIGGLPIDLEKTYIMANSDYVVDGGGGFNGLKQLPQQRTSYLLRESIVEYCAAMGAEGKKINDQTPIRITVHE
jgi:2',3'-cyclic-nucleotide 2'-phosphodiesterase (5'-nucleotidase family)